MLTLYVWFTETKFSKVHLLYSESSKEHPANRGKQAMALLQALKYAYQLAFVGQVNMAYIYDYFHHFTFTTDQIQINDHKPIYMEY
jgi:hypothetical protein